MVFLVVFVLDCIIWVSLVKISFLICMVWLDLNVFLRLEILVVSMIMVNFVLLDFNNFGGWINVVFLLIIWVILGKFFFIVLRILFMKILVNWLLDSFVFRFKMELSIGLFFMFSYKNMWMWSGLFFNILEYVNEVINSLKLCEFFNLLFVFLVLWGFYLFFFFLLWVFVSNRKKILLLEKKWCGYFVNRKK